MLPPRPSLLVPLFACLACLCHVGQSSNFSKCGTTKFIHVANTVAKAFSVCTGSFQGKLAVINIFSLDGTRTLCNISPRTETVSLEQSIVTLFNNRGTSAVDSLADHAPEEGSRFQDMFYEFDDETAIPWHVLDNPPKTWACEPSLVAYYHDNRKLETFIADNAKCLQNLEKMLNTIDERIKRKLDEIRFAPGNQGYLDAERDFKEHLM